MASGAEVRYWDSDCFLGWLQSEADKTDGCKQVLDAAAAGQLLIATSALTLAEVLNLRGKPPIPKNRRDAVIKFFQQPYIRVIPLVREIAEIARDAVWDYGVRPKDAVHVASAVSARVPLLNTFDQRLLGKSGITISSYRLVIEKPEIPQQGKLLP